MAHVAVMCVIDYQVTYLNLYIQQSFSFYLRLSLSRLLFVEVRIYKTPRKHNTMPTCVEEFDIVVLMVFMFVITQPLG